MYNKSIFCTIANQIIKANNGICRSDAFKKANNLNKNNTVIFVKFHKKDGTITKRAVSTLSDIGYQHKGSNRPISETYQIMVDMAKYVAGIPNSIISVPKNAIPL